MSRGLTGPLVVGTHVCTTPKGWFVGATLLLYGKNITAWHVIAGKEVKMHRSRDLSACISLLEDLQRRGSVNSEKKRAIGNVIDELKRIRRKPDLQRHEQNEAIRSIVEELARAFMSRE